MNLTTNNPETNHSEISTKRNQNTGREKNPSQLLDLECFTSQSITESMLVEFLQEIMKQHTSLSVIDLSPLQSIMVFSLPKQCTYWKPGYGYWYSIHHGVFKFGQERFQVMEVKERPLTFLQSKRVWTELLACRFCFPVPAKEYHSVRVCSADHGVHFLRCQCYLDQQHQPHNCKRDQVQTTWLSNCKVN